MKKILMLLALAGMFSATMAQNGEEFKNIPNQEYSVFTNGFGDNWFISAGVGGEILLGDQDAHKGLGDRISPTFNVGVGKWFTPGLGLRLQYSGYQAKGARHGFGSYARGRADKAGYYDQKFHYMNLHGDVLFNLSAMIAGYNPDRLYEIIPYLGAGFTHTYSGVSKSQGLAVNGGIINKFRISPAFDVNLELSGVLTQDKFDQELNGKHDYDGIFSATVGVTYYFKNRGFQKPTASKPLISAAELSDLRDKINVMAGENQLLKAELNKKPVATETEVVRTIVPEMPPYYVFFNIGSATVSEREKVNISLLAGYMKKFEETKVELFGYADSKTGSAETNKKLSLKRSEAVANVLINEYGISKDRIAIVAEGGVDQFSDVALDRKVQIKTIR